MRPGVLNFTGYCSQTDVLQDAYAQVGFTVNGIDACASARYFSVTLGQVITLEGTYSAGAAGNTQGGTGPPGGAHFLAFVYEADVTPPVTLMEAAPVPEPSTLRFFAAALAVLALTGTGSQRFHPAHRLSNRSIRATH